MDRRTDNVSEASRHTAGLRVMSTGISIMAAHSGAHFRVPGRRTDNVSDAGRHTAWVRVMSTCTSIVATHSGAHFCLRGGAARGQLICAPTLPLKIEPTRANKDNQNR